VCDDGGELDEVRYLAGLAGALTIAAHPLAAPPPPTAVYGALYRAVELGRIFPDSKTFADAVPRRSAAAVMAEYTAHPPTDGAALKAFVLAHFELPPQAPSYPPVAPGASLTRHIEDLWPHLTQATATAPDGSSILTLPKPYVVPGGRFRELYYWDSYFTLIGLKRAGRDDLVEDMIDDFGSLIDRYGHVPNGTRTYYLSRSQPPVFALMLGLSDNHDRATLARRNAWLTAEHHFWMSGGRVVRLADGQVLNRYWDDRPLPRDESYREDVLLAQASPDRDPAGLWRDLRAAAESGWDFSSRWLGDGKTLATIRTTRLLPVDLNVLMYLMERTLADNCRRLGEPARANTWAAAAAERRQAILSHMWNGKFFADYDLDTGAANDRLTAAAAWPLFARIASFGQARADVVALKSLIGSGGIATTAVRTGQQWDAPNGWAPLQWIAYVGLRNYSQVRLADQIRDGWLATVTREFKASGRLLEKYDVDEQVPGGGGEYPAQDGFGWTNGVTAEMLWLAGRAPGSVSGGSALHPLDAPSRIQRKREKA
jgi:alpha,alpha-trehalase